MLLIVIKNIEEFSKEVSNFFISSIVNRNLLLKMLAEPEEVKVNLKFKSVRLEIHNSTTWSLKGVLNHPHTNIYVK